MPHVPYGSAEITLGIRTGAMAVRPQRRLERHRLGLFVLDAHHQIVVT
jgi:hypothetical protein